MVTKQKIYHPVPGSHNPVFTGGRQWILRHRRPRVGADLVLADPGVPEHGHLQPLNRADDLPDETRGGPPSRLDSVTDRQPAVLPTIS